MLCFCLDRLYEEEPHFIYTTDGAGLLLHWLLHTSEQQLSHCWRAVRGSELSPTGSLSICAVGTLLKGASGPGISLLLGDEIEKRKAQGSHSGCGQKLER